MMFALGFASCAALVGAWILGALSADRSIRHEVERLEDTLRAADRRVQDVMVDTICAIRETTQRRLSTDDGPF